MTLMAELEGISPRALSETLKELKEERLIDRESFAEIPPRVEYFLTEDGAELRWVIVPVLQWASDRDNRNGDRFEVVCRRRTCHPKGLTCDRKHARNNS